jgi:hypothetical protein
MSTSASVQSHARYLSRTAIAAAMVVVTLTLGSLASSGARAGASAARGPGGATTAPPKWAPVTIPEPQGAFDGRLFGATCTGATNCLAVGSGETTGSAIGSLVEHWNGTAWADQASPNPTTGGDAEPVLNAVSCVTASDCDDVGYDYTESNTSNTLAELWNGTKWTIETSPDVSGATNNILNGVSCVGASFCMAVGDTSAGEQEDALAEEWNGTSWVLASAGGAAQSVSGATQTVLNSVACTSTTNCLAAGFALTSTDIPVVEQWNGSVWSLLSPVMPAGSFAVQLGGIDCPSASECIAVGRTYVNENGAAPLAESWNGTTWTQMTIPAASGSAAGSFLASISCAGATACAAAGESYDASNDMSTLVESLSGTTWSLAASPDAAGAETSLLSAVACPPASSACVAAGQSYTPDEDHLLAMDLSSKGWALTNVPGRVSAAEASLATVACSTANCVAAGQYFPENDFNTAPYLEQWNGKSWSIGTSADPKGADVTYLVGSACPGTKECLVVGDFGAGASGDAGGAATFAEEWNGAAWAAMATPKPAGAAFSRLASVACPSATSCIAVGYSETTPNTAKHVLAETLSIGKTSKWSLASPLVPAGATATAFNGVACRSTTSCVAVGSYVNSTGTTEPLSEVWNGKTFSILTPPIAKGTSGDELLAVACYSTFACLVTGTAGALDGDVLTLAERLIASKWSVLTSPDIAGSFDDALTSVACSSTTYCVASGYAIGAAGDIAFVAQSNTTSFALATTGQFSGDYSTGLNGIACETTTYCVAAGARPDGTGLDDGLIEQT